ncbi:Uncharacterised protein [Anaerotruncus sp. 2789STDY5834896]|uniref:Uncharacterized protein n=1 Tax=uncultured Anaerotruncus sp. TaxID=905011 RepID=A0A1C6FRI4_9FIRM|nr:Uncharacterised protein [uncultured Anaerotruncus sp.]
MSTYIDELKKAMQEEYNALEMAQKQQEATLNQQKDPIKQDAAKLRGDTYTSSRVSAIGNNEVLAQKGLAGSVYQDPRSGYSETSRVRQDTALRNALNAADLNEQKQLMAIEEKIKQLGYDTGKQKATVQAKWNEKIAQAVREDELRRIQWEREDKLRKEEYERQLALAAASRSYSSGGSSRSSSGSIGNTVTADDIAEEYRQKVIKLAEEAGINKARDMTTINNIQNRAYAQALKELKSDIGEGQSYKDVAAMIGAPSYLW